MSIAILLQQILIIFLEIGTGAAITRLGILDDSNSKFLSNLVMTVSLPCTLLASASIDGGRAAVVGMLKGYVVLELFYLVTTAFCLCLSKALGLTPMEVRRSMVFSTSSGREMFSITKLARLRPRGASLGLMACSA